MLLLPNNFDRLLSSAVRHFWATRANSKSSQGGSRGNVIAGKNLDGFLAVVESVAAHVGLPATSVYTAGRSHLTLPGYYRPTKIWDVLIVHEQRLLAALEFKSQVGSFGNNFNNRSEEAIGSAADLWVAVQNGTYRPMNHVDGKAGGDADPRPPFLGYLMLLEDSEKSVSPVSAASGHYKVDNHFVAASYAQRYQLLCSRMMEQGLYRAAALMLSPSDERGLEGEHRALCTATSGRNLFLQLAGQLAADLAD